MVMGMLLKQTDPHAAIEAPLPAAIPLTHATARLAAFGYRASQLKDAKDDDRFPLINPQDTGLAMWAKLDIPLGRRNNPEVKFELRDEDGKPFPVHPAWSGRSAYLLIPFGYAAAPRKLSAIIHQGSRVAATIALPALRSPIKVQRPALTKAWPDLTVGRCATAFTPGGTVCLVLDAKITPGHALIAFTHGSSASPHDACDGSVYEVQAPGRTGPATMGLCLNYPKSTKELYLEVQETEYIRPKGRAVRLYTPGRIYRRTIIPVSLTDVLKPIDPQCREAFLVRGPGLAFPMTL